MKILIQIRIENPDPDPDRPKMKEKVFFFMKNLDLDSNPNGIRIQQQGIDLGSGPYLFHKLAPKDGGEWGSPPCLPPLPLYTQDRVGS